MTFKLNFTIDEFMDSLTAAKILDETLPRLQQERWLWQTFSFADDGAHYINPEDRGKPTQFEVP